MSSYALTPLAKADVFQIWSYIAKDSVGAADRVEQAIYDACASLAGDPLLGHARRDFTDRTLPFWTLVAVLHGKRNIRRVLRNVHKRAQASLLTQTSRLAA